MYNPSYGYGPGPGTPGAFNPNNGAPPPHLNPHHQQPGPGQPPQQMMYNPQQQQQQQQQYAVQGQPHQSPYGGGAPGPGMGGNAGGMGMMPNSGIPHMGGSHDPDLPSVSSAINDLATYGARPSLPRVHACSCRELAPGGSKKQQLG
ncbi:hypothetical protein LSUE1_G002241 [Lachnellula suecica]|uniref:Uncharacterized protein n=1 Tax=Lachnellula suecica TaxID=602035 RepID=A0A8T9CHR4_9HELO|nr:hypothetical protein LSUE1_G002241 [Lachnellula suecica]